MSCGFDYLYGKGALWIINVVVVVAKKKNLLLTQLPKDLNKMLMHPTTKIRPSKIWSIIYRLPRKKRQSYVKNRRHVSVSAVGRIVSIHTCK